MLMGQVATFSEPSATGSSDIQDVTHTELFELTTRKDART